MSLADSTISSCGSAKVQTSANHINKKLKESQEL